MTGREHPGLVFDAQDLARIRHNVETYPWAQKLFAELRDLYDGKIDDPWQRNPNYPRLTMAFPPDERHLAEPAKPGQERDARVHQVLLMEFALFAVTSGEDKYVARVVELLPRVAELQAAPCDLAAYPQIVNWVTGHDAADTLVAYDLVYHHPSWTQANRRRVEESMQTIGRNIERIGSSISSS